MTDLELKLKLAKELPELIRVHGSQNSIWGNPKEEFWWLDTDKEVTEREWDWVANKLWSDNLVKLGYPAQTWQQRAEDYFKKDDK